MSNPASGAEIRPMRPDDVAAATAAVLRADWGDRRTWFEFATTQPECRPIVAETGGAIVGTGVGTANGAVGWVGTIWVDPSARGAGLGRRLTDRVIEDLEAAGCRTLLLVATDEGRPLYERSGFQLQATYRILETPGLGPDEVARPSGAPTGACRGDAARSGVRPYRADDLEAILALDRVATGEDRGHVIRRFAAPDTTKVLDAKGSDAVAGFVIRAPWGGGATVVPDPVDALQMLDARQRSSGPTGRVRVGLLDQNVDGLAALEAAGLKPIWSAPRLIRGEPLQWNPGWIWGQFNHAIG
ncbi:MAG: GNAT family N-acetyltransferase [Candidatus Limnocylindrales bacterium]